MLALLATTTLHAGAIPAWPGRQLTTLPDGTTVGYRLVGDEHRHAFVSDDGYVLRLNSDRSRADRVMTLDEWQQQADAIHPRRAPHRLASGGFPTTGTVSGMVLLVEFSDVHFQTDNTQAMYQRLMNDEGYAERQATGSARDYFVSQSGGRFTPRFDVVGPVRLSRPMAFYGADDAQGTDANAGLMVEEACRLAHDSGADFSQYDYDGDGRVDFVFLVVAGYGQNYGADANTIWPHTATLPDWGITCELDGKSIGRYACGCELKYTQGTQLEGIGTFCHEFGHVLGLPDFYDTRHSNGTRLGQWDIMDQGCYLNESRTPCAYSAFERYSLGWLDLTELSEPSDNVVLTELTTTNMAYRISTSRPDEYFVLENRQQQGWDAYLPARGMLVAHVDYDASAWSTNTVNNGTDMRYDLVEADGLMSAKTYATDVFPSNGVDKLTDTSSPAMLMRDGTPTGKPIIRIRDVEGTITFRFMQEPLPRPQQPAIDAVGATQLTASWTAVDGARGYRLQARQLLTAEDDPVVADEDFSLMRTGSYGVPDAAEMGTVLDSYLNQEGWTGEGLRQAGGRLYAGEGATLKSPLIDLSEPDGRFTVALRALAGSDANATFSVKALRNTGRELSSATGLEATATEGDIIVPMTDGIGRTRIEVSVSSGELYIDRLRIVKDHVDGADVWAEAGQTVVEDGISLTSATLSGLLPAATYVITLTALSDDDELNSPASAELLVTTKSEAEGIDPVAATTTTPRTYYNILGQRLNQPGRGIIVSKSGRNVKKMVVGK